MSHDSKNCRIVDRCSIDKTLLIKQCWVKSYDEIMFGSHVWKNNKKERCRIDSRQVFESNIGVGQQ